MIESPVVRRMREEQQVARRKARIKGGFRLGLKNVSRDLEAGLIDKHEADHRRSELWSLAVEAGWRVVALPSGAIRLVK